MSNSTTTYLSKIHLVKIIIVCYFLFHAHPKHNRVPAVLSILAGMRPCALSGAMALVSPLPDMERIGPTVLRLKPK